MDLALYDTMFGSPSSVDESAATTPLDDDFWASLATPFDIGAAADPQPLSHVEDFDLSRFIHDIEAGPAPLIV